MTDKQKEKHLGLASRRCKHRSGCAIACKPGGPVPRHPSCNCWTDLLKEDIEAERSHLSLNIDFDFKEAKMKYSEAQKTLDSAYNQIRIEHDLPKHLIGSFYCQSGCPHVLTAFMEVCGSVAITVSEVNEQPTLAAEIELVRLKTLITLKSARKLHDENIKKLWG